ncbi:hypothetical protein HPP92_027283 [Vanilla planifolia]|uniref:Uncharacterized protein n=1 Tax=Vanilla planifolia TaxID=51239 RepID=A0A835PAI9_VANPL|nr:hypothetical protein HPP92_027283 [Vanilla planifolia]
MGKVMAMVSEGGSAVWLVCVSNLLLMLLNADAYLTRSRTRKSEGISHGATRLKIYLITFHGATPGADLKSYEYKFWDKVLGLGKGLGIQFH